MKIIERGVKACGRGSGFSSLLFSTKTARNSGRFAVILVPEPSAAQVFRQNEEVPAVNFRP
jgi:hypothetical protein